MLVTNTSRSISFGAALLFTIGIVTSGSARAQSFTTIDVPGASLTQAFGINPKARLWGIIATAQDMVFC